MRTTLLAAWFISFAAIAGLTIFRISPLVATLIPAAWALPLLAWSAHWMRARGRERRATLISAAIIPWALLALAAGLVRAGILQPSPFTLSWLILLSVVVPLATALFVMTTVAVMTEANGRRDRPDE